MSPDSISLSWDGFQCLWHSERYFSCTILWALYLSSAFGAAFCLTLPVLCCSSPASLIAPMLWVALRCLPYWVQDLSSIFFWKGGGWSWRLGSWLVQVDKTGNRGDKYSRFSICKDRLLSRGNPKPFCRCMGIFEVPIFIPKSATHYITTRTPDITLHLPVPLSISRLAFLISSLFTVYSFPQKCTRTETLFCLLLYIQCLNHSKHLHFLSWNEQNVHYLWDWDSALDAWVSSLFASKVKQSLFHYHQRTLTLLSQPTTSF